MTQRWGKLVLAVVLTLAGASASNAAILCGDFNKDTDISAPDALGTLRAAVGNVECQRAVCDFSGDRQITARDALLVLMTAVGNGPDPRCPIGGCNGPDCRPTCLDNEPDCCDVTTCSGNGECSVKEGVAVCDCNDGWVGATCLAPAELYPFAEEPTQDPPAWTKLGDTFVRPPSYGEQMRLNLKPGTFFIANTALREHVEGGKPATTVPFVFPDGDLDGFELELKAEFESEVQVIDRRGAGSFAIVNERFPQISIYRSLYETDGSVRSVMQILVVEDGGFVSRGIAKHGSNLPNHAGVFRMKVAPLSPTVVLDDIVPVNGTIDDSTLLISEAFFANTAQAQLFEDCNGLAICDDLCADMGVDLGNPGPACPAPPDPCEHVSPCGEGHGPGDPVASHQCNDGEDNDGDGLGDNSDPRCDHAPSCEPGGSIPEHFHRYEGGADFAMFGDVTWCTEYGDDWAAELLDRAWETEFAFHRYTGSADYDALVTWNDGDYNTYEKLVRLRMIGCWRLDSIAEAEACSDDVDDCGPFASGTHKYPYRYGRDAPAFWDGLQVDVWHARGIGLSEPLTMAQVITSDLIGASEANDIPGFSSVVGTNVSGGVDTSPHELGHSVNVTHCDVRKVGGLFTLEGNSLQDDTCPPGLEYGQHELNHFSIAGGQKIYDCFIADCHPDPRFGDADPTD